MNIFNVYSHGQLIFFIIVVSKNFLSKALTEAFHNFFSAGTNWTIEYPTCGGSSQSPINIDSDTAVMADYSNFSISIGYKIVQKGPLQNDGHTCKTQNLLTTYMINKKCVHLFQ